MNTEDKYIYVNVWSGRILNQRLWRVEVTCRCSGGKESPIMSEVNIYDDQVHKQEQRTFLRERFLRLLTSQKGAPVQFQLHERTAVHGNLGPVDIDFAHIQVTDLHTPMGVVPNAVLRTSDILSMKIQCDAKTEQTLTS